MDEQNGAEWTKFQNAVADRFEEQVYEDHNIGQIGMYESLINLPEQAGYEPELQMFFEKNPSCTLEELYYKSVELLLKYHPNGFDGTAEE